MSTVRSGADSIYKSGLVMYLDAANYKSYTSGSTVWTDLSGNKNHGTLVNGPTFNSGNGGSVVFDGSNDSLSIAYNATSMAAWSTAQTIILWEYDNYAGGNAYLYRQATSGYGTWLASGGDNLEYYYGNASSDISGNSNLRAFSYPRGRWNMLVSTRNTSQVRWYVNNVSTNFTSNPYGVLTSTTSNITIANAPWAGRIAIIQAYDRALTAAEVSQNWNAKKRRFGL